MKSHVRILRNSGVRALGETMTAIVAGRKKKSATSQYEAECTYLLRKCRSGQRRCCADANRLCGTRAGQPDMSLMSQSAQAKETHRRSRSARAEQTCPKSAQQCRRSRGGSRRRRLLASAQERCGRRRRSLRGIEPSAQPGGTVSRRLEDSEDGNVPRQTLADKRKKANPTVSAQVTLGWASFGNG